MEMQRGDRLAGIQYASEDGGRDGGPLSEQARKGVELSLRLQAC